MYHTNAQNKAWQVQQEAKDTGNLLSRYDSKLLLTL